MSTKVWVPAVENEEFKEIVDVPKVLVSKHEYLIMVKWLLDHQIRYGFSLK